jgi:CP family cyanate transporter-like MFS transporter
MDKSAAGLAASIFPGLGILGSFLVAPGVKKLGHTWTFVLIAFCWISLPICLLFFPQIWYIGVILAGAAQSANYVCLFTVISFWAKTKKETKNLSSAVQMAAYFVAGIAPTILGMVHDTVHNWQIPIIIILIALVTMLITGFFTYRSVKRS